MFVQSICHIGFIGCTLFATTQSRALAADTAQPSAQPSGVAPSSDDVDAEFANPDLTIPAELPDPKLKNGPVRSFNPLKQGAHGINIGNNHGTEKKRRDDEVDPNNGWFCFDNPFNDTANFTVFPTDIVPAGTVQPFLAKAKTFAQQADKTYKGENLTWSDNIWLLNMRILFAKDVRDVWEPLWDIYAELCDVIQGEFDIDTGLSKTISGYALDNGTRVLEYSLVHAFGLNDTVVEPPTNLKRRDSNALAVDHRPRTLEPRTSFTIQDAGHNLAKRSEFKCLSYRFTLYKSTVILSQQVMYLLANNFVTQMESQSTSGKVFYHQSLVSATGFETSNTAASQIGVTNGGEIDKKPYFHLLALPSYQFTWEVLMEMAGFFHRKAKRLHWDTGAAGSQNPAIGGLIYLGDTLVGAWSWGLQLHAFMGDQAAEENVELRNAMAKLPANPCYIKGYGCFEREVQLLGGVLGGSGYRS